MGVKQISLVTVAVAVLGGGWEVVHAGCSSVGCGRIDWSEVVEGDDGGGAAVAFHGAFAVVVPVLNWGWWRTSGHFVAQCGPAASTTCQDRLVALRQAAYTETPVVFSPRAEEFPENSLLPDFLTEEGVTPRLLTEGDEWPQPDGSGLYQSLCDTAFGLPAVRPDCPGDCDGSGSVTISEVVHGIRMAVDALAVDDCPRMDTSGDEVVTIDEVVRAVQRALQGCR
jgi:hypothetical protein